MELTLKISPSPLLTAEELDAFTRLAMSLGKTAESYLAEIIKEKINAPQPQLTLDLNSNE